MKKLFTLSGIAFRNSLKALMPLIILIFMGNINLGWGQVSITSASTVTESFTGFLGTAPPTNWSIQGTGTRGTIWNGTNQTGGTSGGWYGNENMSFLGSSTASNGNGTWLLQNNTGSIITGFSISFTARLWKSGTASPSVTVSWTNNVSSTNPSQGALVNSLSSLTFNDATSNISTGTTLSQTVSSISIANGDYIFIRFIHSGGSSSDNLGWDDVSFTASLSGSTKPEPTNHVTNFAVGTVTSNSIPLTWTDATGGTVPDAYLIKGSTVGLSSITDPVDGTPESDGTLVKNITQGTQTYTFTGLNSSTTYYFKIYPYTNSGSDINYKTNGTVPTASTTTSAGSLTTDYFKSKNSGDWNSTSTWQSSSNNTDWIDATIVPDYNANTITISNNNSITVTSNVSVDQLIIAESSTLIINSGVVFTILDGAGTDCSVDGKITNAGTITTTGTLVFNNNGIYQHNYTTSAGTIPTATWSTGSTCEIIGYTSNTSYPNGINQAFYNFNWNCTSQTNNFSTAGYFTTVNGTLKIISTGTGSLRLGASTSPTLEIAKNLEIYDGIFNLSSGSGNTNINLSGDFNMTGGTLLVTGSGTNIINFVGSTTQYFIKSTGTISGNTNFVINNGAIVNFGTNILDGSTGTFTLSSGATIGIGSVDGISSSASTGNIQVSGTRSFSTEANYVYNGSSAQVTGDGLPSTVNSLTINNSAGVMLSNSTIVNGTMTMMNGTFGLASGQILSYGASGILNYSGTTAQTTTDAEFPSSNGPASLTINNSNGVILHASRTINGVLSLTSGKLTTSSSNLLTLGTASSVSGGSITSFISGPVAKNSNSTTMFTLPVGDAIEYRPVGITPTSTNATTYTAQFFYSPYPDVSMYGPGIACVSNLYYYEISRSGTSPAKITLTWNNKEHATNSTDLRIVHWNDSLWENKGNTAHTGGSSGTITSDTIFSFSPFTLGSATLSNALPIQLVSFNSSISKRNVTLKWSTSREVNNSGFEVMRTKKDENKWEKAGYVKGNGTTQSVSNYSFEDRKLNTGKYQYRLKQIDNNGNYKYYNLDNIVEVGLPKAFNLSQNYPNPFNPVTKIDFDLPFDSKVSIIVYDMLGREVKNLVSGESKQAGFYTVDFNASNLASGLYFYRMIANSQNNNFIFTKKMVIVK